MPDPTDPLADLPDVAKMHAELVALREQFLINTGKLAICCSKFGINASLEETRDRPFFTRACDERLQREAMLRQELKTANETIKNLREIF